MKKFVSLLLGLTLSFLALLGGCSSTPPLSFNNNFCGGQGSSSNPAAGFKEILTYDVTYSPNYNESLTKSSSLGDSVKFDVKDGVYVSAFEVVSALPENVVTDVDVSKSEIYHIVTELTLTAVYDFTDVNGKAAHEESTDTVKSEIYFLPMGLSYAPIWSSISTDSTCIQVNQDQTIIGQTFRSTFSATTSYTKEKYTVTTNVPEYEPLVKEFEYDYRTVIDNAQLLFALRNISIDVEGMVSLPTVAPSYGDAKTIKVTCTSDTSADTTINGVTEKTTFKNLNFVKGDDRNSGMAQYVKLQKTKTDNQDFRALLVEYAEPITTYGNYLCLGAMVYKLNSVIVG